MDVEIRRIAAGDVDGFHHAVDIVARERKYLAFLEAPPLAQTHAFVMQNIAKGHVQFVAISGGKIIGWCDVLPKDRRVHAHSGVLGMGLLPLFRGKGIGSKLIATTLSEAWRRGFVRVELTVHADNTRAISLYEKVGFKREGVMQDAVLIDGAYKDSILMAVINRARADG